MWGVVASLTAAILVAVALVIFHRGFMPTLSALRTAHQLFFALTSVRMQCFMRSRDDYERYRREAKSIDTYIKIAKRTLTIVSINLVTGVNFHGMCQSLKELLERDFPVEVHISLLDFREPSSMKALSPALDTNTEELTRSIESGFAKLFAFKAQLSQNAQNHLHIHAHRSIPFASAIIIDEREPFGRIQIETKAYKAALDESWGFELVNGGSHKMFGTFVSCYNRLIQDGSELVVGSGIHVPPI